MRKFYIVLFILGITIYQGYSQDFGGFHPEIKWKQINTKPVRVIFPEGMENKANRVANMIGFMHENNRTTVGTSFKKLDLVLNNQGIIPNGYVTLGPYRSEFFTTPFQQSEALGSMPWLDLLSIHEYRHALQYSNFRKGITKIGYILSGESFWALAINLTTPNWLFEGDAVLAETAFSKQGRGRIPSFNQGFRSILSERKPYSYEKVRNGSFKHEVPDHYRLGYLLTSYGRQQYGDDLWMNVTDRTARFKGIIYPFSKATRHFTGLKSRELYKEAFEFYKNEWELSELEIEADASSELTHSTKTVTNYVYSQWDALTKNWLAVKSSYKRSSAIIEIDQDGNESKIVDLGINLDSYFSASRDFIVWAEISGDPRYSTRSYSDLVIYDRRNHKRRNLTTQQRIFSPSISPDQSKAVAFEVDVFGNFSLVFIDLESGEIIKRIPNPDQLYFTYPIWNQDGSKIISGARDLDGQMSILEINPDKGQISQILEPSNNIIGLTKIANDELVFSASFNGKENIFSINLANKKIHQLTQSSFGASHPSVNPESRLVCYTDYKHTGKQLRIISLANFLSKDVQVQNLHEINLDEYQYTNSEGGNILNEVTKTDHQIQDYKPFAHSLKIHSWSPVASPTSIGLNLISDNVLGNVHFEAGYNYYLNENSGGYSVSAVYGQFFPIVSVNFSQGLRDASLFAEEDDRVWERSLGGSVEVPLDYSQGLFYRSFNGKISIHNTFVPARSSESDLNQYDLQFATGEISSSFNISKRSALQNISTPLGIAGEFSLNKSLSSIKASQVQLFIDASFRGLLPNHNLILGFAYKNENAWNTYQYIDFNIYPRGYEISKNHWISSLQINYHFPLLYPDIGFGGLVYLKRVRANIFADLGIGNSLNSNSGDFTHKDYKSVGAEMIFDLNLITLIPLSAGLRISVLGTPDPNNPGRSSFFEVFFPILRL